MNDLEEREEVKKEKAGFASKNFLKKCIPLWLKILNTQSEKIWFKQVSIIWISKRNGEKLVRFLVKKLVKFVSEQKKIYTFFFEIGW